MSAGATKGKQYLSVREVAELTATPIRTVQRWCKDGAITAVPTPSGHSYRIPLDALRERADVAGYALSRAEEMAGW